MHENEIGNIVLALYIDIHRELSLGLYENVYEVLLSDVLIQHGLHVKRQVPIPIKFRGRDFDEGFRADILVENKVLLELKSVEQVVPAHKKQVNTYLKLTGCRLGYLLNFGADLMKNGIYRIVNGLEE